MIDGDDVGRDFGTLVVPRIGSLQLTHQVLDELPAGKPWSRSVRCRHAMSTWSGWNAGSPLADLVRHVVATRQGHATIGDHGTSPWLFPDGQPGRPISPYQLTERLRQLGLRPAQAIAENPTNLCLSCGYLGSRGD
jgi:hypothetical protein